MTDRASIDPDFRMEVESALTEGSLDEDTKREIVREALRGRDPRPLAPNRKRARFLLAGIVAAAACVVLILTLGGPDDPDKEDETRPAVVLAGVEWPRLGDKVLAEAVRTDRPVLELRGDASRIDPGPFADPAVRKALDAFVLSSSPDRGEPALSILRHRTHSALGGPRYLYPAGSTPEETVPFFEWRTVPLSDWMENGRLADFLRASASMPREVGIQWIGVPGGPYRYGQTGRAQGWSLRWFQISKYEITNGQWAAYLASPEALVLDRKTYRALIPRFWGIDPGSQDIPRPSAKLRDRPVVGITWDQAQRFCRQFLARRPGCSGARLPDDLEWEKAARGGADDRPYPWGTEFLDRAPDGSPLPRCNSREAGLGRPAAVDAFPEDVSPYGLIGMSGNVSEWVGQPHNPSYRGGSFRDDAFDCQIHIPTTQSMSSRDFAFNYVGFRVARNRSR